MNSGRVCIRISSDPIGWQLGTDPEVQVATCFNNHLVNGIFKYFRESSRISAAASFFEPMLDKDCEVGAILSRVYLESRMSVPIF